MIKVTVLYPNEEGKQFNFDYWAGPHMEMVHRLLDAEGLQRSELEKGISSADPNAPAPFTAMAVLYFGSVDQVHEGFKTHGREIIGDIANYTDIKPQYQISEVLG